jgi:heat shock protein HspQ
MPNGLPQSEAKYGVGQLVHHKKFDYRGVIIDVDHRFNGTDDWYNQVARSRPPREKPWYHVLVDDSELRTYVAERNLEPDYSGKPVNHPDIAEYFEDLTPEGYVSRRKGN